MDKGEYIMDKIAVLIPCYNEEVTIKKVIEDYKQALPEATIYVYDNNSADRTAEIAKEAGAIVKFEYLQGKGNVIRSMFQDIEAECYLMIDGDDTYPSESAREMVELVLANKADLVVGDRLSSTYFTENKRPFHNVGNKTVRFLINTLFKSDIRDVMSGYRAFSYRFVKTFPVLSKGFEVETEMTIHTVSNNMMVKNVIIDYRDRPEGSYSKLNTYSDGFKVLKTILSLFKNYKPLVFFNLISLILGLVASLLMIPVLVDYFQTGLVPRIPTLMTSLLLFVVVVLSFFTGVILDNFTRKNRVDFENNLMLQQKNYRTLMKEKDNE